MPHPPGLHSGNRGCTSPVISVLLVHDNTDLLEATRQYLERLGEVRVEVVNSTKHALEVLRNRSYDVIVSYYQLPEVNGIEFFEDFNGVEFLKLLKQQGIQTPFVLYNRTNKGTVVVEDINYASETACRERSPITDLRDVIKQAVLRKRAERDLSLRFEQLNALLSATPLAIATLKDRVVTYANGPMSRMLGYEDGYLAGKPAQVLFTGPEEYTRTCRELLVRVDDEGFGHADTVLVRKDKKPVHCHLRMRPADPADPGKGEIWVFEDTTPVRTLQESLKESELRYRELLQNTQSMVMKVDPAGTVTFFNKAASAFFGWSPAEIVGKNVVGTIIEQGVSGKEVSSFATDLGFSAEGYAIRINEHVLRSGEHVWVSWTNKVIRDSSGRVAEILCLGNDITDHDSHDRARVSTAMWRDKVIAGTDVSEEVFDAVFHICMEISKEGREGKSVGTSFLVGDAKKVMEKSKQLILNPFEGHRSEDRTITNPELKENIKELALLDGAFVVQGNGVIEAAARYITIDTSGVGIPKGLGTRHSSVAGMTLATKAIGIVISQSGGKISIFRDGRIVQEIS